MALRHVKPQQAHPRRTHLPGDRSLALGAVVIGFREPPGGDDVVARPERASLYFLDLAQAGIVAEQAVASGHANSLASLGPHLEDLVLALMPDHVRHRSPLVAPGGSIKCRRTDAERAHVPGLFTVAKQTIHELSNGQSLDAPATFDHHALVGGQRLLQPA